MLSPAYDMNPDPFGEGLKLNISEFDNAQDLDLALEVAPHFRLSRATARCIVEEVVQAVKGWRQAAGARGLSRAECDRMEKAFRVSEAF